MRDFASFVRERVTPLALPAEREQKIIDEWAAHLEEIYDGLRADGRSDEDAWAELQRQLPNSNDLNDRLLDGQPVLRLAHAVPGAVAKETLPGAVRRWRETL